MPRRTALVLLAVTLWPASDGLAQQGDTLVLSLEEVERRALENSPLLRTARAELDLSRAKKTRADHARYLPNFNLRNVWGPIPRQRGRVTDTGVLFSPDSTSGIGDLRWFTQVDLQATQPLYTFGKAGEIADAARSGVDASEANLEGRRAELLFRVRELYWGLLLGNELLDVAEGVLENVREAEERLQERYEEGSATQNDLFKFRIFKYEVRKRHREAVDRTEMARTGLRAAIGLEEGSPFRLEPRPLAPVEASLDDLTRYTSAAVRSRPELAQLQAGIAARRSLAEAEESDRWPRLFVGAEISLNEAPSRFDPENPFWDNRTNFFRPGLVLGFDWNLNFQRHGDEARITRYEAERLEARVRPLVEQVRRETREAYLTARRARADVDESREALKASRNWLRAEMQTFDIGIGDIEDVITAFRANVEMETEHLHNISELNTALAELSRAVGVDVYRRARGGTP